MHPGQPPEPAPAKAGVGRDNCVNRNGAALQIPPQRHRHHYVRATVRVHQYPDGQLAIFERPSCLARFDATGKPINATRGRLTPLSRPGLMDLSTTRRVAHNPTGPITTAADM